MPIGTSQPSAPPRLPPPPAGPVLGQRGYSPTVDILVIMANDRIDNLRALERLPRLPSTRPQAPAHDEIQQLRGLDAALGTLTGILDEVQMEIYRLRESAEIRIDALTEEERSRAQDAAG